MTCVEQCPLIGLKLVVLLQVLDTSKLQLKFCLENSLYNVVRLSSQYWIVITYKPTMLLHYPASTLTTVREKMWCNVATRRTLAPAGAGLDVPTDQSYRL